MAKRWIVTALGQDRPGIVAGVTQALYRLGCNLEDSAMTRLEGEFAIMLIFSAKASIGFEQLRKAFGLAEKKLGLSVHLKPLSRKESTAPRSHGSIYRISVYGGDKPGIVYKVAQQLTRLKANVTDVHTHRSASSAASLYLMILEVELPGKTDTASFERKLKALGKRLGVQVSVHPAEPEIL